MVHTITTLLLGAEKLDELQQTGKVAGTFEFCPFKLLNMSAHE
jgi:hypothetical protein